MTRARQPKPTAPPLAATLRAALASDWRTLAALDVLAGDPAGTRRHRVHAALNELRAAGVVFEERAPKGVAEVRELPPVADGATCPACRAVVREHDDHHGQCTIGIRDCAWWAEREQRDGTDEDHAAACGPRITPSAETMATVRALVGEPDTGAWDPTLGRGYNLDLDGKLAEEQEAAMSAADAPAPPVDQAAPVEPPRERTAAEWIASHNHEPAPAPKGPGPSSRCAVCARPYASHDKRSAEIGDGHPFTPKPRGRPTRAPSMQPPIPGAATAILPRARQRRTPGPIVAVDGGRVERLRLGLVTPETRAMLDAVCDEADERLAAAQAADPDVEELPTASEQKAILDGAKRDYEAAVAGQAAAEPETSRGEAPGEQDHGEQDQSEATDVGTIDDGAEGERAASHPANGGSRARHGEQRIFHERAPRENARASGRAPRRGGKTDEPVGLKPSGCRPPLCHADSIHEPARVRGFARALCEAHRRWVEGAGGSVASEADAAALAPSPSTPPEIPAHCDVPLCPAPCNGPLVTRAEHHRAGEYAPGVRLVCLNCGDGREGTDAEVEKAERARRAWEAVR